MTVQQCRDQIQQILDRACPDFRLEVYSSYGQSHVQHCIGRIQYHFSIDKIEWEKVKWPERIVRIRLLDALRDLRDFADDAIKEIE